MQQQPHCLDLAGQQVFQGSVLLIFCGQLDLGKLYACHRQLLEAWPLLATRLNMVRSRFIPSPNAVENSWLAKSIPETLDSCMPSLAQCADSLACLSDADRATLRSLLRFPYRLSTLLFPPVLSAKVVGFKDGWIFESIIQHPLCDAAGHHHILKAYTTLLKGTPIPYTIHRRPAQPQLGNEEKPPLDTPQANAALTKEMINMLPSVCGAGWIGFLWMMIWVWFLRLTQIDPRVEKTVHVPASVIDRLAAGAEGRGLKVTRGDLLMGIVRRAMTKAFPSDPNAVFRFSMNIARDLEPQSPADLHNPFWIIFVPPCMSVSDNTPSKHHHEDEKNEDNHIITQSTTLRTVIHTARSAPFQHAYLAMHAKMATKPWKDLSGDKFIGIKL
ncbi:hypothetical protein P168DRAFT_301837 [Aspergillus campestris IBT 28561]|uniref:Uncharacterized protein n=1 Tax=Aspergillus campestris (strain IBT 28561) TaxID=1392248 RepID=A0A2I1DHE9_ASPC2|nr:uncharacterized protein P168DRAFT_301837 [Aspergillus campestris IBT 28561]PKY09302.1 hypothetical protein P168DRAFT_301837 [Aspergillus campestris IBT 28561]